MNKSKVKNINQARRRGRIRAKVKGEPECPRLCVSRSNRYLYLQIIDDTAGKTLVGIHSRDLKAKAKGKDAVKETEESLEFALGKLLAAKAAAIKISRVVFDRAGRKYHGRIKAVADGARAGGLKF